MTKNTLKKITTVLSFALLSVVSTSQILAQGTPRSVPDGQKLKQKGVIASRSEESFTMNSLDGADRFTVEITPSTEVKTHRTGVLRGGTEYPVSYLLRGLRVEVEGRGNAAGSIVATAVRFDDQDLRTAQALQSRVDPVEATANKALSEADRANHRINGLNDYEPIKTITVPFATGSSSIGPKGRAIIDEAAAWVRTQNTRGWMVAVVGFADSSGKTAANKTLSEKRANAVIGYLVSKHNLPLTRLVQPFGAGVDDPIATNDTAEGRAQNRRVEIRLLLNKGIAGE